MPSQQQNPHVLDSQPGDETAMAVLLRSHPSRVDYCLSSSSIFQTKGFVTTLIEQNVGEERSRLQNRPKRLFALQKKVQISIIKPLESLNEPVANIRELIPVVFG